MSVVINNVNTVIKSLVNKKSNEWTVLECFPKESPLTDFTPDKMRLDVTGTYLSIGNKPCGQRATEETFLFYSCKLLPICLQYE